MTLSIGTVIVLLLVLAIIVVPFVVFLIDNRKADSLETRQRSGLLPIKLRAIIFFIGGWLALAIGFFVDISSGFGQDFGKIFFFALGGVSLVCSGLFFGEYRALEQKNGKRTKSE